MMINLYIKAAHIIFVVTWFAGLFYIVRLFIYHVEAEEKEDNQKRILQDQFKIMEQRLWNFITAPSMIITLGTGLWLAFSYNYFQAGWMHLKLALVILLLIYHFLCLRILRQLRRGEIKFTSTQLRMWNEIATLLLVAIVFTIVVKSGISIVYGLVGLVLLSLVMMTALKMYKKFRKGR